MRLIGALRYMRAIVMIDIVDIRKVATAVTHFEQLNCSVVSIHML
jgi:hypothetical protein